MPTAAAGACRGGFADPHEAPWDAIVREVREETGLEVAVDSLLGIYAVPANRLTAHAFICRVLGGELETTDETLAVGWFAEHALPAPFFPTHVARLRDAFALRRGDLAPPILRTMPP